MKYQPVIVTWLDITTRQGWISQDDADEYISDDAENVVFQCGFLYEEDENLVCILNSFFKNQDLLGDVTKIPRGAIREIKYL